MVKKKINRIIVALTSLLLCAVMIFGYACADVMKVFAAKAAVAEAINDEVTNDEAFDDETSDEAAVIDLSNDVMSLSDDDVLYLSDRSRITHDPSSFSLGNTRLWMAPSQKDNIPNKAAQAKIEGAWYTFEYGVYAHANSVVKFNISEFSDTYKYFSAYVGLCNGASKSNGVLVRVDFSQDGTNWTTQPKGTTPAPDTAKEDDGCSQFVGYNQDFLHLTYDVTGVKWIRLFANINGSDAADQVIWTDAKLTTTKEAGGAGKTLDDYDKEIKAYGVNANLSDKKFELLLLQREFVSRVGQYALTRFMGESNDNKVMLKWLLEDLDSLREFMIGGTPFKGNYFNSLNVLAQLYKSYGNDLKDKTDLKNKFRPGRTFGELCRTMMFSVALTHDGTIGSYLQGSKPENQSEPLRRYAIYKYMYQTGRFIATPNYETQTMFGSMRVEEMRYVMCNIIDDESILWLNDYVQTRINAAPQNASGLHTPHSYVKYTDPNYGNPVFYNPENFEYFNNLFAVDGRTVEINGVKVEDNAGKKIGMWDTEYTVPAGEGEKPYVIKISRSETGQPNIQKVWMNFKNKFGTGSVCGGISKSGCNIRGARGIPANVIGQPGHAAILYFRQDANGNGSWAIDNDVGGWLAATKGERHLLGWGNEAWQRNSSGTVVYFHLAQECLNDYDNYVKAEEYCWLAKVYKGDLEKQEQLYEKALKVQIKNLDAWSGLLFTYKANKKKTVADFSSLVARIADTLWNHPVPMHCLFRLLTDVDNKTKMITGITDADIDAVLKNPAFTTQIKAVEAAALEKARTQGSSAAKSKVNWILGASDMSVADFSFDGENGGCIVWSDTYKDGSFTWKYSIDGKKSWKEVTFHDGDSHAYQLSEKELDSVSPENGIYVYIVGASPDNAYKINLGARPALPDTLYANDWENKVIGVDSTYEWRYTKVNEDGEYKPTTGWVSYDTASPDCSGDTSIEVRLKGTAKKLPSEGRVFTFTADKNSPERSYISVNYLSMVKYSTQSLDAKRPNYAVNAIDGNAKTYWHTDYAISIKGSATRDANGIVKYSPAPYLIIKLDEPRYISALEFSQLQYNSAFSIFAKKAMVYVSEDNVNWPKDPAGKREDLLNAEDLNAIHFEEPVYGQYIKLEFTELHETGKNDGVFTTVSLINIYEDTTKKTAPGGEAMKDLSEITPGRDISEGLGAVIDEDEALAVGGEPTFDDDLTPGGTGAPRKSNAGLVAALVIVGVVLVAGAAVAVFVLLKRKKAVAGGPNNPEKAGKPKASKTAAPKATPKATPAETPKATPKASTPAPKTSTTATPKASTTPAPKASTPAPKASTATLPKASTTAAPKASTTTLPKASTTATPKASTTTLPKASTTTTPKASTTTTPKATTTTKPTATVTKVNPTKPKK